MTDDDEILSLSEIAWTEREPSDATVRPRDFYSDAEKELYKEDIYDLWCQRYTMLEISEKIGLNRTTCTKWLREAQEERRNIDPMVQMQRDLRLAELAIRALIPKVLEGANAAHRTLIMWMERRARYLGLDAPEELRMTIGHNGSIEAEISELARSLGINIPLPGFTEAPKELPAAEQEVSG